MHVVILLAAGLALAYLAKPKDKQSHHMAVLAIFGIAYFCIWQFADFYLAVFAYDDSDKNILFVVLMVTAVILCVLPWTLAIARHYAIALAGLFVICAFLSFALDKQIKNALADWGGYFNDPIVKLAKSDNKAGLTQGYDFAAGGISIDIPVDWQKHKHASGLDYFVMQKEGNKLAELRPRCFHHTAISIPEIIDNIIDWEQSRGFMTVKQCHMTNDGWYQCMLRSASTGTEGVKESWRWLVMDQHQAQNVELDFIFYTPNAQARRDAEAIIASLKLQALSPLPLCVSPSGWF